VVVERSTKNGFPDFGEYTTVLGYASIYEQEHWDKLVKELEKRTMHLVAVKIPRAGGEWYFGFLRLP
jgi:hypothetical protein